MIDCVFCGKSEPNHTADSWIHSHKFTPASTAERWHVVLVTEKRIECAGGCDGELPHLSEYRASDVNPNR